GVVGGGIECGVVKAGAERCYPAAVPKKNSRQPRLKADGSKVITAKQLNAKILKDLFENRICAIRVPNFASQPLCKKIKKWATRYHEYSRWGEESGGYYETDMYYGLGLPVDALQSSKESAKLYFAKALESIREIRAAAAPDLAPVDRL